MLKFKIRYLIPAVLYCGAIYWLSAKPDPGEPPFEFPGMDKFIHAAVYAGLAALVSVGLRRSNPGLSFRPQFVIPVLFAALYGLSDEVHQLFVPLRNFDLLDIAADTAGAFAAQGLLFAWWQRSGRAATVEETGPPF